MTTTINQQDLLDIQTETKKPPKHPRPTPKPATNMDDIVPSADVCRKDGILTTRASVVDFALGALEELDRLKPQVQEVIASALIPDIGDIDERLMDFEGEFDLATYLTGG